jgi:cytoskeletal protein CcmA (bactofilin family)
LSQPAHTKNFVDDAAVDLYHAGDAMRDVRAARIFRRRGAFFCGRLFT